MIGGIYELSGTKDDLKFIYAMVMKTGFALLKILSLNFIVSFCIKDKLLLITHLSGFQSRKQYLCQQTRGWL